jgi:hypothetical protein
VHAEKGIQKDLTTQWVEANSGLAQYVCAGECHFRFFAWDFSLGKVELSSLAFHNQPWRWKMRTETGTFELRGDDMMMRELTYAETNEVAGGTGNAFVFASQTSGAASSSLLSGNFTVSTTNTTALAAISANNIVEAGANNTLNLQAFAQVF